MSIGICAIVVIGVLGYAVVYRFGQENQPGSDTQRLQVVASFYPLAHIAEQVGQEFVEVVNLTPAGAEPHDFDPSPKDIASLQRANVFIYNGGGFEPWVSRIAPELEQRGVRLVEATQGLDLLAQAEDHEEEEEQEESADPHVWLDPVLVRDQVRLVASAFAAADALHAEKYLEHERTYMQQLDALHQDFTVGLSTCALRDIVVSHSAFSYLATRYDLNMIPIIGFSPNAEPSPARLAEIARLVRDKGITHIFFEALISPKIAETIAQETGAQTLSLNPLEGLTEQEIRSGKDYISVQRENLRALRIALDCV